MNITQQQLKTVLFEDLKRGDVFYFMKDYVNDIKNYKPVRIYMRCGSTDSDKYAVNLYTGIMYSFDDHEPVQILEATMNVYQN